jgi:AbrB family looped-hinge helix DNA binding protein
MQDMAIAQSRLTSQGQISVPAEVRRKLGLVPGSVLEWDEVGGTVVVRRVGQFSSEDIHTALFAAESPKPRSLEELKQSVGRHLKTKHARR